jgi:hypothetical protein
VKSVLILVSFYKPFVTNFKSLKSGVCLLVSYCKISQFGWKGGYSSMKTRRSVCPRDYMGRFLRPYLTATGHSNSALQTANRVLQDESRQDVLLSTGGINCS